MTAASGPNHDALYHRLFSHPAVVAQPPRGFAGGSCLAHLDLGRMTRLNAAFHAQTGQRREGGTIWRVPRRDGADTCLRRSREFQSASDHYTAPRVLAYAGLLRRQLVNAPRSSFRPPPPPNQSGHGDEPVRIV